MRWTNGNEEISPGDLVKIAAGVVGVSRTSACRYTTLLADRLGLVIAVLEQSWVPEMQYCVLVCESGELRWFLDDAGLERAGAT
jgi:hypothetical protein